RSPRQQAAWIQLGEEPDECLARAARLLADKDAALDVRLAAARTLQKLVGDVCASDEEGTVWEGYSPREAKVPAARAANVAAAVRLVFPAGNPDLDRELCRVFALVEDREPETLNMIVERLGAGSHPVEEIHYLIVLARLRAPRSNFVTARVAETLLALDRKITKRRLNRDRNWPLRIAE